MRGIPQLSGPGRRCLFTRGSSAVSRLSRLPGVTRCHCILSDIPIQSFRRRPIARPCSSCAIYERPLLIPQPHLIRHLLIHLVLGHSREFTSATFVHVEQEETVERVADEGEDVQC